MHKHTGNAVLAGLAFLLLIGPAQAKVAGTKHVGAEGVVTLINASSNTITIHNKKLNTDTVVTITPTTKYTQTKAITLSDLAIGDKVEVAAADDLTPGETTIAAKRITELSPLSENKKHEGKKSVEGIVATATPTLTLTGDDGTTYTVTTDPTTHVLKSVPASLSDVIVGDHLHIVGSDATGSLTAKEIMIAAPHGRGKKNLVL